MKNPKPKQISFDEMMNHFFQGDKKAERDYRSRQRDKSERSERGKRKNGEGRKNS